MPNGPFKGRGTVTDEIYEHLVYEGRHVPIATLPGMRERTITISGASKTSTVTGWRIGWIVAPAALTAAIRKVHDFLVGAPAPLQEACATGIETLGQEYCDSLHACYRERRDVLYREMVDVASAARHLPARTTSPMLLIPAALWAPHVNHA